MKWFRNIILLIIIVLLTVMSCRAIAYIVNDDKVVAKVGKHRLSLSEVRRFIPEGTSSEDSVRLAMQYINVWASEKLFSDLADKELSKQEKDVTKELEEYRIALLRYRFEQRYINERLDTTLTDTEISEYYESRSEDFIAEVPAVKARFMRISSDSPNLELIKKKMSSDKPEDLMIADSLAWSSADRYTDFGGWTDIVELAKEFGSDYSEMLTIRKNSFITTKDDYGKTNIAYIEDYVRAGEILPLEYCEPEIRDILIGVRKHKLVNTLERDLIEDARDRGKFIIY